MERIVCPNCGFEATSEDFVCPRCEVLLNEAAAELEPVSVVQALLSSTNARAGRGAPPKNPEVIGDRATVRATVLMDECTVPHLLAGVDLALNPLHQFEAYVTSHVDGAQSVPEIAQKAGITKIEAMAVFQSLAFRRIVELRRSEPRAQPPPPEPAAAEPQPAEPIAPEPPQGDDYGEEPKTDPAAAPVSDEMLAQARAAQLPPLDEPGTVEIPPPAIAPPPPAPRAPAAPAEPEPSFDLGPSFGGAPEPAAAPQPEAITTPARPAAPRQPAPASKAAQPAAKKPGRAPSFDLGPAFASGNAAEPPPKPKVPPPAKLTPMRPATTSRPAAAPAAPAAAPARTSTTSQPAAQPVTTPARKPVRPLEDHRIKASPPKAENVLERAVALEQKGDIEGAVAVLKRAIAQVPKPAPLFNKMALVLIKKKEYVEAVALLEKATTLEPDNMVYQQNLYKAVGLVAAKRGSGAKAKPSSPGLFSKLIRGK